MLGQSLGYDSVIRIGARQVSLLDASYFIADVASNHDGDLDRAKALIHMARDAGADAVKFQHFKAERIVSERGFRTLGGQFGHQAGWGKPVVEVYRDCEVNRSWNDELAQAAHSAGIDFLTTPYDYEAVDSVDALVPAFKIGSGDITWTDFIAFVAAKGKPVLLATGASSFEDVERAVAAALAHNSRFALLQCNTNYTGSVENFRCVNLRVLQAYALRFPGMILGLSDHTPGHTTVLGAIALGARIIEKHFTDDNARSGPDHAFSMNPASWREMIERARELESAQGDGIKRVEENERETVVLQRRCLRLARDLPAGAILTVQDIESLRPAPIGALAPYQLDRAIGRRLLAKKQRGDELYLNELTD
jgi:N-acetylneuraminate synthase